ncbi:uncharacterized protein LOC132272725 [Cornus florida]|uniref:uncharacterized protein LOC132272725 n=1 Tax=Cornus florida TaxID=4283 RepID=UPI002899EA58|nr:uncharacterized protein LOC132272725 [Cornus florida]
MTTMGCNFNMDQMNRSLLNSWIQFLLTKNHSTEFFNYSEMSLSESFDDTKLTQKINPSKRPKCKSLDYNTQSRRIRLQMKLQPDLVRPNYFLSNFKENHEAKPTLTQAENVKEQRASDAAATICLKVQKN